MAPISTSDVVTRLNGQGFDVSPGYISYVLREGILHPPERCLGRLHWAEADIDRLRSLLKRRGRGPDGKGTPTPTVTSTGIHMTQERGNVK